MRKLNGRYSVIDFGKFDKDVKKANLKFDDNVCYSTRIKNAGISPSTYCTSVKNAEGHNFSEYEPCERYGIMQTVYLDAICNAFKLNMDNYILKKKPQRLNAISAYDLLNEDKQGKNSEVIASIESLSNVLLGMSCDFASRTGRIENELSTQTGTQENILNDMVKCLGNLNSKINDIGKIQVQSMEYLKQIADGIQLLNDKWK